MGTSGWMLPEDAGCADSTELSELEEMSYPSLVRRSTSTVLENVAEACP